MSRKAYEIETLQHTSQESSLSSRAITHHYKLNITHFSCEGHDVSFSYIPISPSQSTP